MKETKVFVNTQDGEMVLCVEIPHKGEVIASSVGIRPDATGQEAVRSLKVLANSFEELMDDWDKSVN